MCTVAVTFIDDATDDVRVGELVTPYEVTEAGELFRLGHPTDPEDLVVFLTNDAGQHFFCSVDVRNVLGLEEVHI